MPQFLTENGFAHVPFDFIENHLPGANATFVKIYIYLLMLGEKKEVKSFKEIAETLGILESDLVNAVEYWQENGLIFADGENVCFGKADINHEPIQKHDYAEEEVSETQSIAEAISSNAELSDMFMLAQEILGKTITENDMQTIYWLYQDLKMPIEVILLLIEYCVSKGKNRISYIEKVAVSWNEMGLNNVEAVTNYLKSEEQKTGFLYSVRRLMGIADRNLSQIEEQYLTKWHNEFMMSEEMIALAYEYCIIQTAKLSFPYMDKIITRWHTEGITTVADAETDNKKFKNRARSKETAFSDNKYDSDSLERLTRKKNND
ncbi:MAG: DnaD domain protein [Clostridia bacterium]|nr:DnaD domain protein [Clostridia bacterium]